VVNRDTNGESRASELVAASEARGHDRHDNRVWGGRGSNPRPMDYESTALTD
jgi:hypothetical protein